MSLLMVIVIVIGVWVLILSGLTIWQFSKLRLLSKNVDKGNLVDILTKVLEKQSEVGDHLKAIDSQILRLDRQSLSHIQKVGLVRFNPFNEMGGDHSFVLVLLDAKDTGFALTGLHARDRTRVYMKTIIKGEGQVELSKEEVKALKIAKSI